MRRDFEKHTRYLRYEEETSSPEKLRPVYQDLYQFGGYWLESCNPRIYPEKPIYMFPWSQDNGGVLLTYRKSVQCSTMRSPFEYRREHLSTTLTIVPFGGRLFLKWIEGNFTNIERVELIFGAAVPTPVVRALLKPENKLSYLREIDLDYETCGESGGGTMEEPCPSDEISWDHDEYYARCENHPRERFIAAEVCRYEEVEVDCSFVTNFQIYKDWIGARHRHAPLFNGVQMKDNLLDLAWNK